ncbi:MAG: MFS transporter [Melioribacteraceae bacterium]
MNTTKKKSNKLFNRNYFLLWQGQFVSRIGSQVYLIAMIIWIKESTDSASLLGIMGFIGGLPAIVFSIIGGTFADRHSRKNIIIFSDLINGILMLVLAFLFYFKAESTSLVVIYLMFVTVITSIIGSYFGPAISAAIPDIVHKDKLASANSWSQGSQQIVTILGLGLGGILYVLLGAPLLALINGITFLFSAISELFINIPQVIPKKAKSVKEQFRTYKKDTIEGFKYIWERAGLRNLVLTSVLTNFFSVPIALLLPFYIDSTLHVDESWFGYLLAISAVGSLVGYLVSGLVKLKPKLKFILIGFFIFIDGLFYILLGLFGSLFSTIVILFLSGFVGGFIIVHIQTILQITTDTKIRGRVFGFVGTISGALIPIGMGLAGYVADITNKNIPVIYLFSGLAIILVSIFIIQNKSIRDFLQIDDSDSNKAAELKKIETKNLGIEEVRLNLTIMEYLKQRIKK